MGFWIYMLIMDLLIPLMMIGSVFPTETALRGNFEKMEKDDKSSGCTKVWDIPNRQQAILLWQTKTGDF